MGDVLGGIGGAIGGIIGNSDRDKATAALQQALANYQNINPNVNVNTNVTGDTATQAIQNQLLQQTLARARAGGLNASDIANVQNILGTGQQVAAQGQAAAMDQARQQGTAQGNSGILGSIMAAQQGANAINQAGVNAAGLANQAAIGNTTSGAEQAGALRGQNIGVETGNVNRGMALAEQNKMNEFNRAQGIENASRPLASQYGSNAQNTAAQWQGMGEGIGSIWDQSPWAKMLNFGQSSRSKGSTYTQPGPADLG